jgi:hypothetical protein
MSTSNADREMPKYRLLAEVLKIKNMLIKPMYSTRDLAEIFDVSARAIQSWATAGKLTPRHLPGRWKYLTQDVEDFLLASQTGAP